ncbi:MAG: hypothetical protein JWL79_133 [Frankiales bacterium]|nr:hypothetical protein [Frankiales bacterium]
MSIKITKKRLSAGGSHHQHITDLKWVSDSNGETNQITRAELVDWIDNKGGVAHTGSGTTYAKVHTVHPANGVAYVQTYADGQWGNNLLSLPSF